MNLTYSYKRTITTSDLYDATDPPLIFEVLVRPAKGWAILYNTFEDDGSKNISMALELISMAFLTVSQIEEAEGPRDLYPLDTVPGVQDLQAAIEENNPGYGEDFICTIAWAFGRNHYNFLGDHLGNLLKPLPQLNGSSGKKTPALVS